MSYRRDFLKTATLAGLGVALSGCLGKESEEDKFAKLTITNMFDPSSILQAALRQFNCTGALCAISDGGRIGTFSAGSISVAEHERPYYIYSITKTYTAAAVLLLCEQKGDFLDRPFQSFIPDSLVPETITVRQLLNHTAGLSDYFGRRDYREALQAHPDRPWSYAELMEAGLKGTPLFAPGKGWAYSNPGYAMLKELIEKLSGLGYFEYLEKFILRPHGLTKTRGFVEPDFAKNLIEGDAPEITGDFRPQYAPGWILTGCLISTVGDVARFYDALFAGRIISWDSLRNMTEAVDVPVQMPAPTVATYGLGLMHVRNDPLGVAYGHGGGGPGYTTYARHYPQLGGRPVTLSLVLNKTHSQQPFDLVDEIVRGVLRG